MRTIERSSRFKKDWRQASRNPQWRRIDGVFAEAMRLLVADLPLPVKFRDHRLTGAMKGFRECHLLPDLLLVYQLPDATTLRLVRLGSHADIFG